MLDKIRLGIIGCGNMMKSHVEGVKYLDNIEVTAVCDFVRERAEDMATVFDHPYVTTDWKDMVEHVDSVLVALPHDLHYECGLFFARNKKHVLMEKPLCNTEEECIKLINACEEEQVVLMCAYPVRYWPGIVKLKEMIDSGEYGKVFQASIWTEQMTRPEETEWHATARIGGGQFFSHGCHYVDVLLWLLGDPVEGIHFGTNYGGEWLMRETTSVAIMKFESGAVAYHGGTWAARGTKMGYDFQIHTDMGMIEYDHYASVIRFYNQMGIHKPGVVANQAFNIVWEGGGNLDKQTQFEIGHFADCIINGKRPLTDGRSALNSLRVIWRMYEAERTGKVADLRGLGSEHHRNFV